MDLKEHYDNLYYSSLEKIKNNQYHIDPHIHSATDNRFGLTLLIRPTAEVKNKIQDFLSEVGRNNPNQYFYPNSDIHITVLSLISCSDGFTLKNLQLSQYKQLIKKSLENTAAFAIHFSGITASNSAILIQGFPKEDRLNEIRNKLRVNFKNSDLQQSIDQRYLLQTAHASVVRFSDQIKDKESLLTVLEKYRNHDFGTFQANEIELVYNDWYQKEKRVQKLAQFKLQ